MIGDRLFHLLSVRSVRGVDVGLVVKRIFGISFSFLLSWCRLFGPGSIWSDQSCPALPDDRLQPNGSPDLGRLLRLLRGRRLTVPRIHKPARQVHRHMQSRVVGAPGDLFILLEGGDRLVGPILNLCCQEPTPPPSPPSSPSSSSILWNSQGRTCGCCCCVLTRPAR